ncbi:MAG: hypothetical protein HQL02_11720 [Nitrospirae bacterium]|nr:hypothetical protein [Nitrospirota bacterium]
MKESCPGSQEIRNPFPEPLRCLHCGTHNEIWSDETELTCSGCGKLISREIKGVSDPWHKEVTCLNWCPAARECVGAEKYQRLMGDKTTDKTTDKTDS